jgi:hypothetical protein
VGLPTCRAFTYLHAPNEDSIVVIVFAIIYSNDVWGWGAGVLWVVHGEWRWWGKGLTWVRPPPAALHVCLARTSPPCLTAIAAATVAVVTVAAVAVVVVAAAAAATCSCASALCSSGFVVGGSDKAKDVHVAYTAIFGCIMV